jgi:hypothetical protein
MSITSRISWSLPSAYRTLTRKHLVDLCTGRTHAVPIHRHVIGAVFPALEIGLHQLAETAEVSRTVAVPDDGELVVGYHDVSFLDEKGGSWVSTSDSAPTPTVQLLSNMLKCLSSASRLEFVIRENQLISA